MNQKKIAFALYDGFSTLEFAALFDPLAGVLPGDCAWETCALTTDVYDAQGLHFYPTLVTPSLAGREIVVIPGGPGVEKRLQQPALLEWLATAGDARTLVATGSGVLLAAAAGLAWGRRVSALAGIWSALQSLGARPAGEAWLVDGSLVTASGPAAALELAGFLHPGRAGQLPALIPISGGSGEGEPAARRAEVTRETGETRVEVRLDLDGSGSHQVETGLPFLDHMLAQVAVHGLFDLAVTARGDLHIDPHHTVEDVALALGSAIQQALGDKAGIARMATAGCPMDESLAWVAVDFSGRPYCIFKADWHAPAVGGIPVSLFAHFYESLALNARCNLHAAVSYGRDDHHQAEALFKALGRALSAATRIDPRRAGRIPSSKGVLF